MDLIDGYICGSPSPAGLPPLYVYAYSTSPCCRTFVFRIDLEQLIADELDVFTLMDLFKLAEVVNEGAACLEQVVAVLAGALHSSQELLFNRPPRCAAACGRLISAVRAMAEVLHRLTAAKGPLIFTESKGHALPHD